MPARRLCPRLFAALLLSLPVGGCATWRSYRVGVPVAEIVHLERQRVHAGRTAAVVVGVPAVALGVTYVILCGINSYEGVQ